VLSVVNEKDISIEGKIGEKDLKPSTTVEIALQITPFYAKQTQFQKRQNEHNFRYDKILRDFMPLTGPKNKPNSKPIQTQSKPISKSRIGFIL